MVPSPDPRVALPALSRPHPILASSSPLIPHVRPRARPRPARAPPPPGPLTLGPAAWGLCRGLPPSHPPRPVPAQHSTPVLGDSRPQGCCPPLSPQDHPPAREATPQFCLLLPPFPLGLPLSLGPSACHHPDSLSSERLGRMCSHWGRLTSVSGSHSQRCCSWLREGPCSDLLPILLWVAQRFFRAGLGPSEKGSYSGDSCSPSGFWVPKQSGGSDCRRPGLRQRRNGCFVAHLRRHAGAGVLTSPTSFRVFVKACGVRARAGWSGVGLLLWGSWVRGLPESGQDFLLQPQTEPLCPQAVTRGVPLPTELSIP